jgi:ribonucrease Y
MDSSDSSLVALSASVVVAVAVGLWLGRRLARHRAEAISAGVRQVTAAMARAATVECAGILRAGEIDGREEARALGAAAESSRQVREAEIEARIRRLAERQSAQRLSDAHSVEAARRAAAVRARIAVTEAEVARLRGEVTVAGSAVRAALERAAGQSSTAAIDAIAGGEIEDARLAAARAERLAADLAQEGAAKGAKRVMGIAMGRFFGHYLTERLHSVLPLPPGEAGSALIGREEANLRAIEAVAGVTLALAEPRDSVRLEGLDGVGREVARRTIARLLRQPGSARDPATVTRVAKEISVALDAELLELGRRAFSILQIAPAHLEIVKLVGRLNYRTSFTQNQWKHAIEAAFLCGMMADELGLDEKLARRAALMHDIGKALTHELDGSHAVIGADYARRLGETEMVANAIGAHHTDEPFNSPYAYLVAAGDALSGGRPGARRQTDENYLTRIEDLERITRGFRGVAEAFAVQGGREVRIYVQENRVDDLGAIALSSEIAGKISQEMRFPGQIRVTVIRELKAVEVAS